MSGIEPCIVLDEPQLGENIGMAARAMLNCGLSKLRLVKPRDGWPSEPARKAAAGADIVIDGVELFSSVAEAVADLAVVYATTARPRDMIKRVVTPRRLAAELHRDPSVPTGILFGREAVGLHNDAVALADAIVSIPVNPDFKSLNLAQAVFCIGYEWRMAEDETPDEQLSIPAQTRPADKAELVGLFEHLEQELDDCGFLRVAEKRPTMVRNIRNMLGRADLTEQEVRTFRGIIAGLTRSRRRDKDS